MRARHALIAHISLLLALPACLFGDDDDCLFGGGSRAGEDEARLAVAYTLRNPHTGACETFGSGGSSCGDPCGVCPAGELADPAPPPTWGFCESHCTGLDEDSCLATEGCRGIYADGFADLEYLECWSTDMTGPVQGGGCEGLDADECSRHDDCAAVHQTLCSAFEGPGPGDEAPPDCSPADFDRCIDPPGEESTALCDQLCE